MLSPRRRISSHTARNHGPYAPRPIRATQSNPATAPVLRSLSRFLGASSHTDGAHGPPWVQYDHTNSHHPTENIMKVRKNIEGLFLVAAFVATSASFATAQNPQARAEQAPVVVAAVDASIPTVVVSAKRLTAAEKAALN